MTEKQVQDALLNHLSAQLTGAYPSLQTSVALDKASRNFVAGVPMILVTPHGYEKVWPDEEKWEFLVEFSASIQPDKNKTAQAAIEADRSMIGAVHGAIHSDANYRTLRDAGLYHAKIAALPEDQRGDDTINPHVFSCSTF